MGYKGGEHNDDEVLVEEKRSRGIVQSVDLQEFNSKAQGDEEVRRERLGITSLSREEGIEVELNGRMLTHLVVS